MSLRHILTMVSMCGLAGSSVGICINMGGLFYTSVAASLNTGRGSVSFGMTLCNIAAALTGLIVPKIMRKVPLKLYVIIAAILLAGGTCAVSLSNGLVLYYVLNIVRGIGAGLAGFVLCTSVITNWYYAKNGLMTSIVMAFSGLPGVVLSPVYTNVIESKGWQAGYITVGLSMLLFHLPALLCPLSVYPQEAGLLPYGWKEYQAYKEKHSPSALVKDGSDFHGERSLFVLTMAFTVFVCVVAGIAQHFPGYAESAGYGASVGAYMLSASMAANIVSKVISGVMTDQLGSMKTILTMALVNLFACIGILLIPGSLAKIICAFFFGFSFSNSALGMSTMTRDMFGMENYTKVYPITAFVGTFASAMAVTFLGFAYDILQSYGFMFVLAVIMQVCVWAAVIRAYRLKGTA